jgi:hypothetical protein
MNTVPDCLKLDARQRAALSKFIRSLDPVKLQAMVDEDCSMAGLEFQILGESFPI